MGNKRYEVSDKWSRIIIELPCYLGDDVGKRKGDYREKEDFLLGGARLAQEINGKKNQSDIDEVFGEEDEE
jgi:hypothetical protein